VVERGGGYIPASGVSCLKLESFWAILFNLVVQDVGCRIGAACGEMIRWQKYRFLVHMRAHIRTQTHTHTHTHINTHEWFKLSSNTMYLVLHDLSSSYCVTCKRARSTHPHTDTTHRLMYTYAYIRIHMHTLNLYTRMQHMFIHIYQVLVCVMVILARTLQRYDDCLYSRLPYDRELQVALSLSLSLFICM